ncbi:MAG: hypothetical protein ABW061_05790, partial [Polyangiaceae bacterium]
DASILLGAIAPDAARAAHNGQLAAEGSVILNMRLNPYDTSRYSIEGHGQLGVYNESELLISVDIDIGNAETHALADLAQRHVVLPVRQHASLNPALLLDRQAKGESRCSVPGATIKVTCMATGIGSPFSADYFVKVHLVEIVPGKVFAVDRERGHEVFRTSTAGSVVFGCVHFDEAASASKLIDLRGRDFVAQLKLPPSLKVPVSKDDALQVRDVCQSPTTTTKVDSP